MGAYYNEVFIRITSMPLLISIFVIEWSNFRNDGEPEIMELDVPLSPSGNIVGRQDRNQTKHLQSALDISRSKFIQNY